MSYLKKSSLKIAVLFFILVLISCLVADFTISSTLNSKSSVIKSYFRKYAGFDVSFGKISFGLLNGVKFKDFEIYQGAEEVIYVRDLRIYFSLPFLFRGSLIPSKIIAIDAQASTDIAQHKDYLFLQLDNRKKQHKNNGWLITKFPSVVFQVRNLKIFVGSPADNKGFLSVNSDIKTHAENLSAKIVLNFKECDFNRSVLREMFFYKFSDKISLNLQLAFMKDDLLINNIVAASDNIKISGAGIVYDFKRRPVMDVKLITTPLNLREMVGLKSKIALSGLLNIVANIRAGEGAFRLQAELLMPKAEFYFPNNIARLSNAFCNIILKNDELEIKELSALVNYRLPVLLTGKISHFLKPEFNFTIESNKNRLEKGLSEKKSNFLFKVKSQIVGNDMLGEADLSISSVDKTRHFERQKDLLLKFRGLKMALHKDLITPNLKRRNLNLSCQEFISASKEVANGEVKSSQSLKAENLQVKLAIGQSGIIKAQLNGSAYNGLIEGLSQWNLASYLKNNYLIMKLSDLSISDLKAVYPVTADISGTMSGWFYFKKNKDFFIEAIASVKNGRIADFNLVNNIADFLGIQSIKQLEDIFLSAVFEIKQSGISVKRFKLHNNTLNLDAQLSVDQRSWIDGRVSLTLSREVLEESNILRALLSMVKEKSESIDFDFQVSGYPNALRIELLEGEFKNKLMRRLGKGIRSQIENEINKAVGRFREKNPR